MTRYEEQMYRDIGRIAKALEEIGKAAKDCGVTREELAALIKELSHKPWYKVPDYEECHNCNGTGKDKAVRSSMCMACMGIGAVIKTEK